MSEVHFNTVPEVHFNTVPDPMNLGLSTLTITLPFKQKDNPSVKGLELSMDGFKPINHKNDDIGFWYQTIEFCVDDYIYYYTSQKDNLYNQEIVEYIEDPKNRVFRKYSHLTPMSVREYIHQGLLASSIFGTQMQLNR